MKNKTLFQKGHKSFQGEGEKNSNWKGDNVSYSPLHKWVKKYKGKKGECSECHIKNVRTESANISGKYKRDVNDYRELCVSCHKMYHGFKRKLFYDQKILTN